MNLPKALLCASALIVGLMLAGQPAMASGVQVTFTESGDVLSVGGMRITNVSCIAETCSVTLNAPTGATFVSTNLPATYTIDEGNGIISDQLTGSFTVGASSVTLTFTSFDDSGAACPMSGCNVVETGGLQFPGINVHWNDGTVDTVGFQSDAPVPEPASLILLGSGLAFVGGFLRRRSSVQASA